MRRQETDDIKRRFNELKKLNFSDTPPSPQSPLTKPVIDSLFDDTFDTFFTLADSPVYSTFPPTNTNVIKNDSDRPFTDFNKDTNVIEMIPKIEKKKAIDKKELSDQLSKLFPDITNTGEIPEKTDENIANLPIDKLVEILSKTDKGQICKALKFFVGEKVKDLTILGFS